jgi:DNA-binding LacI/PurR family transcriptional regulator
MSDTDNKPITLQDVATRAGVSTSTASRALAGNPAISHDVRQRIVEVAQALRYTVPFRKARGRPPTDMVTVIMPPIGTRVLPDPFILELLGGITIAMRDRGRAFCISPVVPQDDESLNAILDDNPAGAYIILGQTQYHKALNRQFRLGRTFVVWGPEMEGQLYCSVAGDNVAGAMRLTQHLLRRGRERIVFLGMAPYAAIADRMKGYAEALDQAGIGVDPQLILHGDIGYDDASDPMNHLIDDGVGFDAVFASSDMLALGVMTTLTRRGIRIPEDVAVVGYDDIALARHATPALTTVRQNVVKAGQLLVSKLARRESGLLAASERLPTEMIVRESCGG